MKKDPVQISKIRNKFWFKHSAIFLNKSLKPGQWVNTWTEDAQRGNSLHCTVENSILIPNF